MTTSSRAHGRRPGAPGRHLPPRRGSGRRAAGPPRRRPAPAGRRPDPAGPATARRPAALARVAGAGPDGRVRRRGRRRRRRPRRRVGQPDRRRCRLRGRERPRLRRDPVPGERPRHRRRRPAVHPGPGDGDRHLRPGRPHVSHARVDVEAARRGDAPQPLLRQRRRSVVGLGDPDLRRAASPASGSRATGRFFERPVGTAYDGPVDVTLPDAKAGTGIGRLRIDRLVLLPDVQAAESSVDDGTGGRPGRRRPDLAARRRRSPPASSSTASAPRSMTPQQLALYARGKGYAVEYRYLKDGYSGTAGASGRQRVDRRPLGLGGPAHHHRQRTCRTTARSTRCASRRSAPAHGRRGEVGAADRPAPTRLRHPRQRDLGDRRGLVLGSATPRPAIRLDRRRGSGPNAAASPGPTRPPRPVPSRRS